MTLREDAVTDAQAAWFDTDGLAQTVTYTPGETGVPQEVAAVITYGESPGGDTRYQAAEMVARIPVADIAQPRKDGDIITVGGEDWRVRKVNRQDALGVVWELGCTRQEQPIVRGRS